MNSGILGRWEVGKFRQGEGEVQEMIDICDFAVGLSRQLYGLTIASERPGHRMMEQWHPLGADRRHHGVQFPVAVWAWNAVLALVCGDTVVWKPSEKTPLDGDRRVRTSSRTSSSEMHRCPPEAHGAHDRRRHAQSASRLRKAESSADLRDRARRMGRENRAGRRQTPRAIAPRARRQQRDDPHPTADLELANSAIVFAPPDRGQRCATTLRRLIVHNSIKSRHRQAHHTRSIDRLKIGDPTEPACWSAR